MSKNLFFSQDKEIFGAKICFEFVFVTSYLKSRAKGGNQDQERGELAEETVKIDSVRNFFEWIQWILGVLMTWISKYSNMGDPGHDWDSSSDAASPSPSLGSQQSVISSNGTKKHINRGRWTKEEVRELIWRNFGKEFEEKSNFNLIFDLGWKTATFSGNSWREMGFHR